jgi:purine-binding chemotaxis protein CheW
MPGTSYADRGTFGRPAPDSSSPRTRNTVNPRPQGSFDQAPQILLICQVAERLAAFPVQDIERVTQMAALAQPPGLPRILEGILDLGGAAIPVLRLDRLFRLPEKNPGLYSMLVIVRGPDSGRVAVLADRVLDIVPVAADRFRNVEEKDTFNGCAEAVVTIGEESLHVLAPARLMLAKEKELLAEFQSLAQLRLKEWEAGTC